MLVDIRRSRLYSIEAWPLELGFYSSEPVVPDKPRPPPVFIQRSLIRWSRCVLRRGFLPVYIQRSRLYSIEHCALELCCYSLEPVECEQMAAPPACIKQMLNRCVQRRGLLPVVIQRSRLYSIEHGALELGFIRWSRSSARESPGLYSVEPVVFD